MNRQLELPHVMRNGRISWPCPWCAKVFTDAGMAKAHALAERAIGLHTAECDSVSASADSRQKYARNEMKKGPF